MIRKLLFSLLMLFALATPAAAAARVALVIGNADYARVGSLANPRNDAADLAAALTRIGFEVTLATDLDFIGMRNALRAFSTATVGAEISLVYYAGHGIEVENQNFVIPIDAQLENERSIALETISLDLVTEAAAGADLSIVVLDACRNNPFLAQLQARGTSRSLGRGLSPVEPATGTVVAFAAKGGTVALDGTGRNSPFMKGLLAHIEEPGLDINLLFRKVRDSVLSDTNRRQEPFTYGSLPGREIYLVPPVEVAVVAPPPVTPAMPAGSPEEEFAWRAVSATNDVTLLQDFIRTYPQGIHVGEAFERMLALSTGRDSAPAAEPEPAPEQVAALPEEPAVPVAPAVADPPAVAEVPAAGDPALVADLPAVATPAMPPAQLAKLLQAELNRVGCDAGTPDGIWGRRSEGALRRFAEERSITLAALAPTEDLLNTVRAVDSRVCALVCAVTEVASNGQCVAKTCPSGQRLSSRGQCYVPQAEAPAQPRKTTPSQPATSDCFTFNGQRFCE